MGGGIDLVYMHAAWGRRGQGRVINSITLHGGGGKKVPKLGAQCSLCKKSPSLKFKLIVRSLLKIEILRLNMIKNCLF